MNPYEPPDTDDLGRPIEPLHPATRSLRWLLALIAVASIAIVVTELYLPSLSPYVGPAIIAIIIVFVGLDAQRRENSSKDLSDQVSPGESQDAR